MHLEKKVLFIHGILRFWNIALYTRAHHCNLCWARRIQFVHSSSEFFLYFISSFHISRPFYNDFFRSGFRIEIYIL